MDIQRLRCKVNFQALVFVRHIRVLGEIIVHRLRHPPAKLHASGTELLQEKIDDAEVTGAGKFVVLHLRFDKV